MTRGAIPSPSGSELPTWSLGGKAPFGSGSASEFCGHVSASQKELLASGHFLHQGSVEEEEEAEVFSTPPLTQHPQGQGQSQRGQARDGEDGITMCSMPFTQTQPPSPSAPPPASSDACAHKPRKPRICVRKVSRGAKLRTPSPPPMPPIPTPTSTTTMPSPSPGPELELDPLLRIVLMIPTRPRPNTGRVDILELARSRGIFP